MAKSESAAIAEAVAEKIAALDAIKITDRGGLAKGLRPRDQMCDPHRFRDERHARAAFCYTLPNDVPYEHVFEPWFWRPVVSQQVRIGNQITVLNDALTICELLLVVSPDQVSGEIVVKELIRKDLEPVAISGTEQSGFSAEYRGMTDQWCVVRDHDGHTMAKGMRSKDDAMYKIRTELIPRLSH